MGIAKKIFSALLVSIICLIFISHAASFQEKTAGQLFEKALYMEEAQGDLQKAIDLYQKIVKQFPKNREVAAKAQLHIGLCYEKLGKDEAQKAYQRVIEQYADQHEVVAEARARLGAMDQPSVSTDAKGIVVRQVWPGSAGDSGAPSPDGRYLSSTDWDTGNLEVLDLMTGETRGLTNKGSWSESDEFAQNSIISPDGKQVAYAWFNKDFYELRLVDLDGSEPRILYGNAEVEYVQPYGWSPDGEILALFSIADTTNQIVLVSVADGSVSVLKTMEWDPQKMSLSPDGRYIAYDFPPKEDSPEHDIFVLATDGSREVSLVEHPANDILLGWAPDGKSILFASDRTGAMSAWVIPVADGKVQGAPELVKVGIGRRFSPMGFTQNGTFYYGLTRGQRNVYIATLDPATGKVLAPPTLAIHHFVGSNLSPAWSPDGKYLAYTSQRPNVPNDVQSKVISIRSLESNEEREISPPLKYFIRPRWSPDGKSILVCGWESFGKTGRNGLYQIDVQTGDATSIVTGNITKAEWSPDGKSIYYLLPDRVIKSDRILMLNLENGHKAELFRANARSVQNLAISPDGERLAFSWHDTGTSAVSLKVMSTAGGEARELLRVQEPEFIPIGFREALVWAPDGRYVLFVKGNTSLKEEELWRIPSEGGEPEKLGLAMERISSPRFHPDGKRIAFSAGKVWRTEVWVMENFWPELKAAR